MIKTIYDFFYDKKVKFDVWKWNLEEAREEKQMKKKYPDWDYKYDVGEYHFVYGVKSWDDLTGMDVNVHTMNDFEIGYSRDTKQYSVSIETAYMFKNGRAGECKYLRQLLSTFEKYMDEHKLNKNEELCLYMSQPEIDMHADTIEQLYTKFRMYVEGYCAVHDKN